MAGSALPAAACKDVQPLSSIASMSALRSRSKATTEGEAPSGADWIPAYAGMTVRWSEGRG